MNEYKGNNENESTGNTANGIQRIQGMNVQGLNIQGIQKINIQEIQRMDIQRKYRE